MCHDLYCEIEVLFSVYLMTNKCNGKTCAVGKYVPWLNVCRGENMYYGNPWEHMCLGKTCAMGKHMPRENMCRWKTCDTGKYVTVKRVPGENMCHGKPWEHMCLGKTCAVGRTYAVRIYVP